DGVANWLDQTIQIKEKYLPVVSFAVTFIGVVVLVFYLGKLIEKAINMAAMKPLNKLAGALFSVLKYGLIMSVILGFLLPINKNLDLIKQSTINESVLAKPIEGLATTVIPAVKESDFYKALNGGKLEQWKDEIIDDLTD
ncbi:MAG: CvpA family protein, partial [Flavobacteriales bacterium]